MGHFKTDDSGFANSTKQNIVSSTNDSGNTKEQRVILTVMAILLYVSDGEEIPGRDSGGADLHPQTGLHS